MNYNPENGFPYYYELVKHSDLYSLFYSSDTYNFLKDISEDKAKYRYSQKKWSIKQIVGHITDHEKIKTSRAFLLSRNQEVQLWSYDQNSFVNNSRFNELSIQHLVSDFSNVRKATMSFLKTLSSYQLNIKGMAQEYEVTLEDFLKTIIGHETHHINIIKTKYLKEMNLKLKE